MSELPTKKPRYKPGLRSKKLNLLLTHKHLLTILGRDVRHLMLASHQRQLTKDESSSLINYLKIVPSLMKSLEQAEPLADPYDGAL